MDDLPEEFALAVEAYNREIESNFGCFLLTAAKLADMEQEYHLPLSKLGNETVRGLFCCTLSCACVTDGC